MSCSASAEETEDLLPPPRMAAVVLTLHPSYPLCRPATGDGGGREGCVVGEKTLTDLAPTDLAWAQRGGYLLEVALSFPRTTGLPL
ncbi:hypothetical protein JZ751_017479 [Albula glossodonta]|uniref:Uncharacterized protein n=1 Tax=Albula glossodonta TaxID=121402 RepID=A0A8T2PHU4_9TELE|nr:hypothetical protein JZ751_017479 [Albula glossodonta]